jgi:hypothetical protein
MITKIAKWAPEPGPPFANLLPIVAALVADGNAVVDGGFVLEPGGWNCRLARAIDFTLIRDRFALPASIQLSPPHDTVLDRLTWSSIEGPGAHPDLDRA